MIELLPDRPVRLRSTAAMVFQVRCSL